MMDSVWPSRAKAINFLLSMSFVPSAFRSAIVSPILKAPVSYPELFPNSRPGGSYCPSLLPLIGVTANALSLFRSYLLVVPMFSTVHAKCRRLVMTCGQAQGLLWGHHGSVLYLTSGTVH